MEFIVKREICKDFLDKYNKIIYPELLSRIIEIGILTLKLSFNKLTFSPKELDDIIYSLNEQNKKEKRNYHFQKLKKLTKKICKPENIALQIEKNDSLKNNTISFNNNIYDKYYINNTNFYDSNYYIPETKYFRNRQLYQKRLENPLFTTQNKNVYPFWWWNFPDSEDESILNSSDYISNSQSRSLKISDYDEAKIFKKSNYNNEINMYNDDINDNIKYNDPNYFYKTNQSNYKISYDKNLNVIGIELSAK